MQTGEFQYRHHTFMKTIKFIIANFIGTVIAFLLIFISAGRIDYWQGWTYISICLLTTMTSLLFMRIDKDLINERSKPGEGVKKWDKPILAVTFLAFIFMSMIAGLDSGRFHWSPVFHSYFYIIGIVLTILGQILFFVAQKQNRFFSSMVRIQTDRGHAVCDTGLYSLVRHPAYLSQVISNIGFPLLFGSLWSIIPSLIAVALLTLRTYLEDNTLKNELEGYIDYANKVRFRFIPGIW
jgi:protein-S-isoprenylcysteine O-methyltransferase Ste14